MQISSTTGFSNLSHPLFCTLVNILNSRPLNIEALLVIATTRTFRTLESCNWHCRLHLSGNSTSKTQVFQSGAPVSRMRPSAFACSFAISCSISGKLYHFYDLNISHITVMHKENLFAQRVMLNGTAVCLVIFCRKPSCRSSTVSQLLIIRKEDCRLFRLARAIAAAFLPR